MKVRKPRLDVERAETIALRGLAFLAADPEQLGRFLRLTGIDPGALAESASDPATLTAVLEHFLGDESLLMVFAAQEGFAPDEIAPAHALLSGKRAYD